MTYADVLGEDFISENDIKVADNFGCSIHSITARIIPELKYCNFLVESS